MNYAANVSGAGNNSYLGGCHNNNLNAGWVLVLFILLVIIITCTFF